MVSFTATLQQFAEQGEKTGWTYIHIPEKIALQLKSNNKKSFRVKGKLDNYAIKGVSLLPMGGGDFIMAFNADMRKGTGKKKGAQVKVQLVTDKPLELNKEFIACLHDEPDAVAFFNSIPKSFQNYFSKWIESAKTEPTRTKRIAMAVSALSKKMNYGEMIRAHKKERDELGF